VNRDPKPASLRCEACGLETTSEPRSARSLAAVYVVVVACASCRTPFVALARN
jgi:uncharacterized protein (DUF983 family)